MPKRRRKTRPKKIEEAETGKTIPLSEFAVKEKTEIKLVPIKEEPAPKLLKEVKPESKKTEIKLVERKEEKKEEQH